MKYTLVEVTFSIDKPSCDKYNCMVKIPGAKGFWDVIIEDIDEYNVGKLHFPTSDAILNFLDKRMTLELFDGSEQVGTAIVR